MHLNRDLFQDQLWETPTSKNLIDNFGNYFFRIFSILKTFKLDLYSEDFQMEILCR